MATDNQLKILDAVIFFMSIAVMGLAAFLMVGVVSDGLDNRDAYTVSGILSLFLMLMAHSILTVVKRGFFMSGLGAGAYRVLVNFAIPEFDGLLFPVGRGEVSSLMLSPKITPPPLKPIHTPGFIYIMRRDDGIYKLGKTTDPNRRLSEHSEDYGRSFELIKCFAVPDMTNFEQLALRMTKQYGYKREKGRKELRRMSKRQINEFMVKFGNVVRKTYN